MYIFFKIFSKAGGYLRGLVLYLTVKLCGGRCKGIPFVGTGVRWKYPPHPGIEIGKNVDIGCNCFFDCPRTGKMRIGNNVKFTHSVLLAAANSLIIGDDTMVAEFTSIRDSTHGIKKSETMRYQATSKSSITIGNDVWIGRGVLILGLITIENGVVIGANSICTKGNYEEYGVYYGSPCVLKKKRV